ncbi:MAG TPA: histone deacetylase [Bacillota bacterium]|nr:histone deacetylase [Bacillota bacterium]
MVKTGIVYSPKYLQHFTGTVEGHKRLQTIWNVMEEHQIADKLVTIEPYFAPLEYVHLVHTPEYIEGLSGFASQGGGTWAEETIVSRESYEVALLAAGGSLAAVDAVMEKKVDNVMALIRPPGHHALRDKGGGFCLLNNVAIAAKYAQKKYGLERVFILDWDVHHGNGLQSIFYDDPSVLYFSVHQDGIYPRTGWSDECGAGPGEGFTVNVPLPKQTGNAGYYYTFTKLLQPILNQFKPDIILVAAGFDAHFYDPLGSLEVTTYGYMRMTSMLMEMADQVCNGRLVSILEGGYDLATVGYSVSGMISVMGKMGISVHDPVEPPPDVVRPQTRIRIDNSIDIQKKFWQL